MKNLNLRYVCMYICMYTSYTISLWEGYKPVDRKSELLTSPKL